MSEEYDREKRDKVWQFRLNEYSIVESKWRFLQGFRYAVMAFAVASHAGLVQKYHGLFTSIHSVTETTHSLERAALVLIPFLALLLQFTVWALERRLRYLYADCSNRGVEIEQELELNEGIFQKLDHTRPSFKYATHSHVFYFTFSTIVIGWCYLFSNALQIVLFTN